MQESAKLKEAFGKIKIVLECSFDPKPYITMNLFTKAYSLYKTVATFHLLQFYLFKSSLSQMPTKTALLLLRAIPIFLLSSRSQHST
jgi:hypothetical protein